MSTEERIKFDARLWENCFNADPEDAYVAGALSERNKVIEEVVNKLESEQTEDGLPYFNYNQMFKIKVALQSLKV